MQDFAGKTGFITGGASGMGLAMAHVFGKAGMNVVIADVNAERLSSAVGELRAENIRALDIALDVTNFEAWGKALLRTQAEFGPVHLLCANAGIVGPRTAIEDGVPDVWRRSLEVNVLGPFFGARHFIPHMKGHGEESHIVVTASLAGFYPAPRFGDYHASKYATVGLTETLRLELAGSNIGVSLLLPGQTRTTIGSSSRQELERAGAKLAPLPAAAAPPTGAMAAGADPRKIAERVLKAIRGGEFYIVTHPVWKPLLEARFAHVLGSFGEPADPSHKDDTGPMAKLAARIGPPPKR